MLPKEIRVIQLIDSLEPGGAERMAVTIANELADKVTFSGVVVTRLEGGLKNTMGENVGYDFLNKKNSLDLKALFRLRNYIKANKINIVHAHGSSYFFAVLLKLTMPFLTLFWHDHFGNRVQANHNYFLLRILSVFFDGVFTVNEVLKNWAQKKLWVKLVLFLPNFISQPKDITPITSLKGTPHKRIVFLANLHHPKNHLFALTSFLKSGIANEGWTLHLIGKVKNDSYSKELKDFISHHNLDESVFIYGSCIDVSAILKQACVGILVSAYEGFPVTLLEYGMAGLTVICTDVGYCDTIIQNELTGYLIAPNNALQLQKAFVKISNDSDKNSSLATNLNTFVKNNYAAEQVIQKLTDAYRKQL